MTNDNAKTNHAQEAIDIAASTLGRDLMALVLQEIRALPDVWQKLPEHRQNEVIERIRNCIEYAVPRTVSLIASQGCKRIVGELEKINIADKRQAVISISSGNETDSLYELYSSIKEPVLIVLSSPAQFTGGMDEIKGEKDQRDIFDEKEREVKGGTVARIMRDKKDK